MARLASTIGLTVFHAFQTRFLLLSRRRSVKNPPATWKEAWERSIDWEIEDGVRQL